MKYHFVFMGLLCLLALFCTTSCDKEKLEDVPIWLPGDQEFGFAKGKKNKEKFEASAFAYFGQPPIDSLIIVAIVTESESGYLRERINLATFEWIPQKYTLSDEEIVPNKQIVRCTYGTMVDGGDVSGDNYDLDIDKKSNQLEITEVDIENKLISGKFTATLYNTDKNDKSDPKNPDVVTFRNVSFEATITQ
ncbi:MAG: hypothetical protein AAF849_14900 [Bacteroidota bacterium]